VSIFHHDVSPPEIAVAQQALVGRLRLFLKGNVPQVLQADVLRALEGEGKLLSSPLATLSETRAPLPAGVWPLLVYFVARTVSPECDLRCVSSAALAIECMVLSIDLDDDVMDGDQSTTLTALGVGRALTVSKTLSVLAVQLVLSLTEQGISSSLVNRLLETLLEATKTVMSGQHRDVLAEQQDIATVTYEQCIEIATAKAGTLMRLACLLGAIAAGANDEQCQQFAQLGENLGISHQLSNDAHDIEQLLPVRDAQQQQKGGEVKTDIVRGKKTLPIFFAAEKGVTLSQSEKAVDRLTEEQVQVLYGASMKTWGMCLVYRERVRDCLQEIAKHSRIPPALFTLVGIEE